MVTALNGEHHKCPEGVGEMWWVGKPNGHRGGGHNSPKKPCDWALFEIHLGELWHCVGGKLRLDLGRPSLVGIKSPRSRSFTGCPLREDSRRLSFLMYAQLLDKHSLPCNNGGKSYLNSRLHMEQDWVLFNNTGGVITIGRLKRERRHTVANGSSKMGTTSRAGWGFLSVLFKLADERAILAKVNANSYSSSCFSSTPVIKVVAQMKNLREGVVLLLRALPSQETCLLLSFVWRRMLLEDEQRLVRSDDSINIPVFPITAFSTYTIFLPFLHFLNSPTQQLTKCHTI